MTLPKGYWDSRVLGALGRDWASTRLVAARVGVAGNRLGVVLAKLERCGLVECRMVPTAPGAASGRRAWRLRGEA